VVPHAPVEWTFELSPAKTGRLQRLPAWTGGPKTVLCLVALLCSLPVVVAFLRKLQALSMLLSELPIRERASQQQKIALRTLLSSTILFAGAVAMSVLVLALSAPLLPPWETLVLLCSLAALLAGSLRTYFVRLYARAQWSSARRSLALNTPRNPRQPRPCRRCWIRRICG